MVDIETLKKSGFFKIGKLKSGSILFDEGDFDDFLYIVESGKISIEKYIGNEKKETKQLAILSKGDIFGEGALSNSAPKEVKILALENTKLLKINGKEEFENFLKKYPREGINLLSQLIESSNKRLLESNFLVTSSYSIVKYISEISEFNNKNLFLIIDDLVDVISADYVVYIEKSPVFENVFISRYDTRIPGKMQEKVLEIDDMLNLQELGFNEDDNDLVEVLKIGNKVIGYLIIGRKEAFTDGQKKSISIIAVSVAGFVKQKQNKENEKEREELEN